MKSERIQHILALVEHIKEPIDRLNGELHKLLNEEVPKESYIGETPEYEKVANYYIGLPTYSSLQELSDELYQLEKTLKQYQIGIH